MCSAKKPTRRTQKERNRQRTIMLIQAKVLKRKALSLGRKAHTLSKKMDGDDVDAKLWHTANDLLTFAEED